MQHQYWSCVRVSNSLQDLKYIGDLGQDEALRGFQNLISSPGPAKDPESHSSTIVNNPLQHISWRWVKFCLIVQCVNDVWETVAQQHTQQHGVCVGEEGEALHQWEAQV